MTSGDRRIAAVATGQLGVFSRAQAHDAGLSDRQLRRRVQSGTLVQTGPNGFKFAGSPETLAAELNALVRDIGEPVFVSGLTAAALHGFDGFRVRRPYHLLVPATRHLTRTNVRLHRTDTIDPIDRCVIDGLPITSAVRTLIELARIVDGARLTACLDSALRDGLVSEALVHRRIAALRGSGRYGLPALLRALAGDSITRGGEGWLEREYLRLVHDAGLPRPDTQVVLAKNGSELVRVDCCFPGTPSGRRAARLPLPPHPRPDVPGCRTLECAGGRRVRRVSVHVRARHAARRPGRASDPRRPPPRLTTRAQHSFAAVRPFIPVRSTAPSTVSEL